MHAVDRRLPTEPPSRAADVGGRFDYIDHAKAFGILLIVAGHSPGMPALPHRLIFSFHVPLFYFLSGFLIGQRKLLLGARSFGHELFRTLFLPYLLFFTVAYGYWLATCSIGPREAKFAGTPWYEPIWGLADGLGADLFICPPLWFFPSLIVTSLAFYVLRRLLSAEVAAVACLCAGLIDAGTAHSLPWRLPWGFDTLGVALSFYAAGHCLREASDSSRLDVDVRLRTALAILLMSLWAMGALANDAIDINDRHFDGHPLLMIPTALCGIASLLMWATFVPQFGLSRWLSRNTLMIFPLHPIVFNGISGFRKLVLKWPDSSIHGPWSPLLYTSVSLLIIAPLIWTVDRAIGRSSSFEGS